MIREQECLEQNRSNEEARWQDTARVIDPNNRNSFLSSGNSTKGEKRMQDVYDSTAVIALSRFAAILDSLLTPRNQRYHRLAISNKNVARDRQAKLWMESLNEALFKYRYLPRANYASQNQTVYKSIGSYGTGILFTDRDPKDKELRYRHIHLAEGYIKTNHQGWVDGLHRAYKLKARDAFALWGEKAGKKVVEAVKGETTKNKEFSFIHCTRPRADLDPARKDYKGMAYASYYINRDEKILISEGGYSSFPYSVGRYELAPGEDYGRGPADMVLPTTKTLNEMKKTVLTQGHRAVNPIYLMADDGVMDVFSAKPGSMVAGGMSADGRALVTQLQPGNIAIAKDLMEEEKAIINDSFLISLFQILMETPTMTATEVMERIKEKGILLAPTTGRLQSEYLGTQIEREVDLLTEMGLVDPMPQSMLEARGEYHIVYDSPLNRTQRAEEAAGLMRTLETALQAVNVTQNPEPMDHFNWDIIIPEISDIQGVPARWMNALEKVQMIREGRQQQTDAATMAQVAPGAAALIKSVAVARKGA